jgi:hypothetical protein
MMNRSGAVRNPVRLGNDVWLSAQRSQASAEQRGLREGGGQRKPADDAVQPSIPHERYILGGLIQEPVAHSAVLRPSVPLDRGRVQLRLQPAL